MPKNNPSTCKKNNVFSNFVYQTNHRFRRGFKSGSFVEIERTENDDTEDSTETPRSVQDICTQTNFKSTTSINLHKTVPKVDVFKERCTQTSKTVLTLPDIESPQLSPDSLSPNRDTKLYKGGDSIIVDESELSLNELDCVPFNRKNNVLQYLNRCETYSSRDSNLLRGNTLTKVYLEKNRNKARHTVPETKSLSCAYRRSPSFVNKNDYPNVFKSQSFVEEPLSFNEVIDKPEASKYTRFKIKNMHTQYSEDIKPVKYFCPPCTKIKLPNHIVDCRTNNTPIKTKRSYSFMSPTIASEIKDQRIEIESIKKLISPTRRGRSASPKSYKPEVKTTTTGDKKVPYIDRSQATIINETQNIKEQNQMRLNLNPSSEAITSISALETGTSNTSTECALFQATSKLKDKDWNTALRGLAEVVEICRLLDPDIVYPHMTSINQRMVELIRSPRSHVCRTSCQAVGHLFEYVKDTRRPEFDELVETLLNKTADANKFIRHDANLALDCMVTHIPTFHAIRAICTKGPEHKNSLVRTAAARLLVCAVVIAGPQTLLNPQNNEYTRRRIILNMVKFLEDRNCEIRKYGERLYKLLYKDRIFELYLKRYLDRDVITRMRQCLKNANGQKL